MNKTKLCLLIASTLFACSCSDDSSTDGCPENSLRSESGKCGCEWPHPEKDDDKYWSESEQRCIESNHPQQNVCANGVAEIDNDSDGIIDCLEDQGCDRNPERSHAGECGCEWPHPEAFDDHDYDHDGILDCRDNKHNGSDGLKTEPGVCGFGMKDTDSDNDGTPDCVDLCPDDGNKSAPGVCGCGTPDEDSDDDSAIFCGETHPSTQDFCPNDKDKTTPGVCGCGELEIDDDHDEAIFCGEDHPNNQDICPENPYRSSAEDITKCPCSWMHPVEFDDHNHDGSGARDCVDDLDRTQEDTKTEPGTCGFGIPDTDTDGDGTPDCIDKYPFSPCTEASEFTPESNLYCIRTAQEFYRLHELPSLKGAKIHILKSINLGSLSTFMAIKTPPITGFDLYNCVFDFSVPSDEMNPESVRIIPNAFLPSLTHAAEFISADSTVKTISLNNTYTIPGRLSRHKQHCPMPYPLFDAIENSTVRGINIDLTINGESTIDNSKATASLAHRTDNATIENVVFSGSINTTSYESFVGGLIADAKRTTIKNTRASYATINAPNSTYVGGLVGKTSGHKTYSTNTTIYATSHDHVHRLTSISGRMHVGGVVGYMEYGTAVKNMSVSIGTLNARTLDSEASAGGIVGFASRQNQIKNIDLKFNTISGEQHVGGLVGFADELPEIANIISIGNKLQGTIVGGLMGNLPEPIQLQNIYNDVISISGETAGGLFGKTDAGFELNTVSNKVGYLEGKTVGALSGSMTSSSPMTWTNVTSIAKVNTTTNQGGLLFGSLTMKSDARLTFQNTVLGGIISESAAYPLISEASLYSAACNEDGSCFDGTNNYYFYQTAPTGHFDKTGELDSLFTLIHGVANGDSDKLSIILGIIDNLNAYFKMENSWKTENVSLGEDTTVFTFPIFRDYIQYVQDTFEDPDEEIIED